MVEEIYFTKFLVMKYFIKTSGGWGIFPLIFTVFFIGSVKE